MKILAMENEIPGVKPEQFSQHLKNEAKKLWDLYQAGVIRELFFRKDRSEAILLMECVSIEEARLVLDSLPLVHEGIISFDVIALIPYPGFSRLFA